MYSALLIGCGNIGALYDFGSEEVQTHAKAFSLHGDFTLTLYDRDESLARKVAERYSARVIQDIDAADFSKFDCVIISSPTASHAAFLERAFQQKVRLVVCEKPLSLQTEDIDRLIHSYKNAATRVIVNYFRRFLPAYKELASHIMDIRQSQKLTNIGIRYQRGFVNNCSHAIDLLQYLLGTTITLHQISIHNTQFDHFMDDPTLSLQGFYEHASVAITGLTGIGFSFFEVDIFFENTAILIRKGGDTVSVFTKPAASEDRTRVYLPKDINMKGCIKDYMKPIPNLASTFLGGTILEDNFLEAAHMNKQMLQYIKK
ncbi:MAG: Gfo/Idh/MocA family oxidoreductase [Bacteroidetes bacterium]|nr:Gfo/Idh/MocA family oxidoreductase [Bacteroidota bacterium]